MLDTTKRVTGGDTEGEKSRVTVVLFDNRGDSSIVARFIRTWTLFYFEDYEHFLRMMHLTPEPERSNAKFVVGDTG